MPAPHLCSPVLQHSPLTLLLQPLWLYSAPTHRGPPCSGPLHMLFSLPGTLSQALRSCCPLLTMQLLTERIPTLRSLLGLLSKPESQSSFYPTTLHPVTLLYLSVALCIKSVYSTNLYWAPTTCQRLLGTWSTLVNVTMNLAFIELPFSQERQKIYSKHGWMTISSFQRWDLSKDNFNI